MIVRLVTCLVLVLVVGVCSKAGPVAAAEQQHDFYWRFATLAPDGVGWSRQIKRIVLPAMHEVTDGRLAVKVYWGGVMGEDDDFIDKMRTGQLDGAGLSGAGTNLAVPESSVLELPFLFTGYGEVDYVRQRMWDTFSDLARDQGYALLAWIDQDFDQIYSTEFPIATLQDFDKARVQNWYGPVEEATIRALGGQPVPLDVPDLSPAMRKGTVNASISPAIWMVGTQMYAVARYITPVKIRYSPAIVIVNLKTWLEMPQDMREDYHRRRPQLEREVCVEIRRDNRRCLEAMRQYGLTIVDVAPEDLDAMHERTEGVWWFAADVLYPAELLEEILAHLADYRNEPSAAEVDAGAADKEP